MTDDRAYLLHIIDACERVAEYTNKMDYELFQADRKTQDAVLRAIGVIGEASKRLSEQLQTSHPDIPWRRIAGMRNHVVHRYFDVNFEMVWTVSTADIPQLLARVREMIQSLT